MRVLPRIASLVAALLFVSAGLARAQGTARSMDFEQSIRIAGMGGAGAAVPWGATSAWGNPATLGYATGWGWEETRTQLVPGLASNVWLRTQRMTAGFGGVGVSWTGQPGGVGDVRLDYGVSQGTDEGGNPTGSFSSFERVRGWGFGVSAARVFDTVTGRIGDRSLSRYGDVSFGQYFKTVDIALAPASLSGTSRASNRDWGVLARVSPSALLRHGRDGVWDADVALGHSVLNADDERFVFLNEDQASPPTRWHRTGFALTVLLAQPTAMSMAIAHLPWLSGLGPLVRVTYASDAERNDTVLGGEWNVDRSGYELSVLGVFDMRQGHVDDPLGEIVDDTRGFGLCIPLGKVAAVRWDYAEVPQARDSDLPDVERRGWSVWVNPAAIIGRGGK